MKVLIKFIAFPLTIGGISTLLTKDAMKMMDAVNQSELTPPAFVFFIAWTLLYILMGISSYLIFKSEATEEEKSHALRIYVLQLAVNFLWPTFYFNFSWYWFSFLWLLLLWVLVFVMILRFYKVDKRAAYLNIPYLLWLTFAAYLNFTTAIMN